MKSSLKKSTNYQNQIRTTINEDNGSQIQQEQKKVAFGTSTFQPIKTNKQSQKLRIAKISSQQNQDVDKNVIINHRNSKLIKDQDLQKIDDNNKEVNNNMNANNHNNLPQKGNFQQIKQDEAEVAQIHKINDQQNGENIIQDNQHQNKMNIINPKDINPDVEQKGKDMKQYKNITIQNTDRISNQAVPEIIEKSIPKKIDETSLEQQKQTLQRIKQQQEILDNAKMKEENQQNISKPILPNNSNNNVISQNIQQNIVNQQIPFDFKIQNRKRNSGRLSQDLPNKVMIEDIPEGYQERDYEKEKMDIRRLFKKNNKNNNDQDENDHEKDNKRVKEIEDKIYNPKLSNFKGDDNEIIISIHTKPLKPFPKILSIVNFQQINKIDPELRFYHTLYELIDQTEKTVQKEYETSPEFLYYLSYCINIIKTSFSKIATNRRKSIRIEQQQEVKECLHNKWEISKQKVMQNMINKYLKKYDKFKNIEDNIHNNREYAYLKKNLSGLVISSTMTSVSQKEIFKQIEEQQKINIIEIDKLKNIAMKPISEGQNTIIKGENEIINQQNRMQKSYEKLTTIVFPDWKEIDSFDEIAWLSSQTETTKFF